MSFVCGRLEPGGAKFSYGGIRRRIGGRRIRSPGLSTAALHYTVGRICEKAGEESRLQFSRRFIAALTETTFKQCESFATDLELFAKHGKRTQINSDDVQLLARKSSTLAAHMEGLCKELAEAHDANKAYKKTRKVKKTEPAQESNVALEIKEDQ
ncbi:Centromere protein S [Stylophora pistillata]|uniref:Centromere protein S n=1 Tax=Stylophora pistillata TaxID=50429 RepID=A0A2B4S861_STYPI|nr:Centromere protein S [Stylophora pistillata]